MPHGTKRQTINHTNVSICLHTNVCKYAQKSGCRGGQTSQTLPTQGGRVNWVVTVHAAATMTPSRHRPSVAWKQWQVFLHGSEWR